MISINKLDTNITTLLISPTFGIYSNLINHYGQVQTSELGCGSDLGPGRGFQGNNNGCGGGGAAHASSGGVAQNLTSTGNFSEYNCT